MKGESQKTTCMIQLVGNVPNGQICNLQKQSLMVAKDGGGVRMGMEVEEGEGKRLPMRWVWGMSGQ